MTKILRIINRFNLGGPTYNVAYLTKYLAPEFETLLIGGEKEEDEGSSTFILEKLGINPLILPEIKRDLNFSNDLAAYNKIRRIIADFKPDIVHTHASKAGALGRLAAANMKVPIIVHTFHGHVFHSYFGKMKTAFYKNVEQYLAKKTTSIVAISLLQKKELVETYQIASENKVKIIPLGFDLDRFLSNTDKNRDAFRRAYLIDEDEFVVSIIGRLAEVKNHTLFLEVIAGIKKQTDKKIRAFIIGDGEMRSNTEHKAKELGLDFVDFTKEKRKAELTFTSWIQEIELPIAGSDVICLTSNNEGTPVSLIEAQAGGKPILSTNVGGVIDATSPETAILSKKGDVSAMIQNLLILINSPDKMKSMAEKGVLFATSKFHYSRLVSDMRNLYNSLLK